jgi:putative protease
MAVRKKAKAKRKKAPARRPAPRKTVKAKKKPAKKAPVRRASPKARKPATTPVTPPARPAPQGERIGVVTHYFSHLSVAVIKLDPGARLRVGDTIHVQGHTSDFKQRVESLQVDHAPVTEVGPQDDFGIKVREHAREHDVVYLAR